MNKNKFSIVETRFNAITGNTSKRTVRSNLGKGEANQAAYKMNSSQSLKEGDLFITYTVK